MDHRSNFEIFKSNVCHRVKELGDLDFIIETLESNIIRKYFDIEWYPESLYLLAMLDYISRMNDIPICTNYNDIRAGKLAEILYPSGIEIMYEVTKDEKYLIESFENAIPEFKRFNIVENEVRNVV